MNFLTSFSRFSIKAVKSPPITRSIFTGNQLLIKTTPILCAEPLKKKKRVDPAVVKAREERRKKKIEKQIRKLEKNARQLKPLSECEVPADLYDNRKPYERPTVQLSLDEYEGRILLEKKWAGYKREQSMADMQMIDRIGYSQQLALDELRKESEELYQEAIQEDFHLLPFKSQGPVETPPIDNYEAPDGNYQDVSKKW